MKYFPPIHDNSMDNWKLVKNKKKLHEMRFFFAHKIRALVLDRLILFKRKFC